jgi:membrane protease YdiL (CAAX protease family)
LLPTLGERFGLGQALVLQAVLFGIWHLVWPIKSLLGGATTLAAVLGTGLALLIGSSIAGFAFGSMYVLTQSLWVPIVVHFLNNAFYNFVHIRTQDGLDKHVLIMQVIATLGLVLLAPLMRIAAR